MLWSWPRLQATACTIPGSHGVAAWKVSQHQPKGVKGGQLLSIAPKTTEQRFSPWISILPMHECQAHYHGGPTYNVTHTPEVRKQGAQRGGLRWVAVGVPAVIGWHHHKTAHSWNKGWVRPKPLKWFIGGVSYTYIGEERWFPSL